MKELSPAVRRYNFLNFPTLRPLANASFPKLHSRVIAVHYLQFPTDQETFAKYWLPRHGRPRSADTWASRRTLQPETRAPVLFSSTDECKAGKFTVCPQGKRKSTTVRPIVFQIPILSRTGCADTNFTVLTQFGQIVVQQFLNLTLFRFSSLSNF